TTLYPPITIFWHRSAAGVRGCGSSEETPQSRHSLTLSGLPPRGKLLIPFERRDVRVVEGARLESVCRGNSTEGSNPSLSEPQISAFFLRISHEINETRFLAPSRSFLRRNA